MGSFVFPVKADAGGGSGDVSAASNFGTDNRVIRSNGTLKGVQASGVTLDDSDNLSGVTSVDVDGTTEATSSTTGVNKNAGGVSSAKNIVSGGQVGATINDIGNSGTTKTVNWNDGNVQFLDMTGNVTLTLSNPISGFAYTLVIKQGAGSQTVTWPAAVKWPGGTAPTLSVGAAAIDVVTLVYNGLDSEYLAASNLNFS